MVCYKQGFGMKKKLQVFISSTFTDLIEERQAAVSAILKAGHIPAGMELFTAGDRSQMETITSWIDESDVYMLILGGRYGSVESTTNLSYTELEFDYAATQNKPMFSVVIKEDALEGKIKKFGTSFLEKENPKELGLFRKKVLCNISSFFEDTKDIKLCIHESLSDFSANKELKGWVSGGELIDTKPLFDEITKLSNDNNILRETIKTLESRPQHVPQASQAQSTDLSGLEETLTNIKITVPASLSTSETEYETSLRDIFYNNKDSLISGTTNSASQITDYSRFMYFNICPKLQIYGLTDNEKIAGVQYRRYFVTPLGIQLLAHIEKKKIKSKSKSK